MKSRLIYTLLALVLALNLVAGAKVYRNSVRPSSDKANTPLDLDLLKDVADRIHADYVDGSKVDNQQLIDGAIKGLVNSLDPHSDYLPPVKYKELKDDTHGQFGGVGIVITVRDGQLTVVSPMDDTPGARAGLLGGDRIMKIDGRPASRLAQDEAVKYLRGEPGSTVTVTVYRPSTDATKDYKLTRAIINVAAVKDINNKREYPVGPDKIGYVRILQFTDKTGEELQTALDKLKGQGMKALVMDLRWNPGGLLDQAVEVCEKFLPRGQLVVSTEGPNPANNAFHKAEGRGDQLVDKTGAPLPIVVLVNLSTASAAEIVTGCLQDARRGTVVLGEKTFGKGSVQNIIPLADDRALKLTVAKYYTPSHKVIHEHGIEPDITVPITLDEERDLLLKRSPGGADSLEEKDRDRVRNAHDIQLERATDLLKGLILYAQLDKPGVTPEKIAAKQSPASGQ